MANAIDMLSHRWFDKLTMTFVIAPSRCIEEDTVDMDKAFALLSGVLNRRGLKNHAVSALAVHKAKHWLTERLPACKEAIRVSKVADGVLYIECTQSVVLQECAGALPELKEFMAKECPFLPLSDIRLLRE